MENRERNNRLRKTKNIKGKETIVKNKNKENKEIIE